MSYTRLRYHLVWSTKHRRPWLTPEVEQIVYERLASRADELGAFVLEVDGVEDHVHLIIGIPPKLAVSAVVAQLKRASTLAVEEAFPDLEFRWQKGFSAFSLWAWDFGEAISYVRRQKEHHGSQSLDERLEMLDES